MKSTILKALIAGTALTSVTPAFAQNAPPPQPPPVAESAPNEGIADIVVTARRDAEKLQDVPVSVQVVTGETLQKQSITQATELSKLAPGLTVAGNLGNSTSTTIALRGITWRPGSGTPATPIYLNEIPFDPFQTIQSLYDIGQIEVLRGPQGTSRGAPSISGAITITTKRPDLQSFGGYIQGQYGTAKSSDVQGAVNIPVIKDVLAIRAAADLGDSEGDRVFSVHSSVSPKYRSRSYRATALFQPTDTISIQGMFQRRDNLTRTYLQVAGTGSPGAAGIPAGFNGPPLTVADRKSVQDAPAVARNRADLITLTASWEFAGQKLTYNYGRQIDRSAPMELTLDAANMLPGYEDQSTTTIGKAFFQTNEIRLSSLPAENRPFDYDIGWFHKKSSGYSIFDSPVFLPGAFGAPGTAPGVVTSPVGRYVLQPSTNIAIGQVFDSFYGNVRFHLDSNTELSGGLSIVRDRVPVTLNVMTSAAATVAAPLSALGGLPCAGFPPAIVTGLVDSYYPGFCDALIPAGSGNTIEVHNDKYTDALYNFSLSHKFFGQVLVYATTGTSFRTGLPAIGNNGLPSDLVVPKPERATSYEVGVKATLGRRLRVHADVYQINYKDQLTAFGGIPYFDSVSGRTALTLAAFYRNVDARVRGAEIDVAAKPLDNLSLGANASYSKIVSRGGIVPCDDPTGPALGPANPINFCASSSGQTLNTQAPFQATINGSYDIPITSFFDAYFRFNVNYQGHNPNYGNFPVDGRFTGTKAYALVDLFAGVTGGEGAWEIGIFAKNVFNKRIELARYQLLNNVYAPFAGAPTGYDGIATTSPRVIGATLRYAFGSR